MKCSNPCEKFTLNNMGGERDKDRGQSLPEGQVRTWEECDLWMIKFGKNKNKKRCTNGLKMNYITWKTFCLKDT